MLRSAIGTPKCFPTELSRNWTRCAACEILACTEKVLAPRLPHGTRSVTVPGQSFGKGECVGGFLEVPSFAFAREQTASFLRRHSQGQDLVSVLLKDKLRNFRGDVALGSSPRIARLARLELRRFPNIRTRTAKACSFPRHKTGHTVFSVLTRIRTRKRKHALTRPEEDMEQKITRSWRRS